MNQKHTMNKTIQSSENTVQSDIVSMHFSEWIKTIEVIGWDLDGTLYPSTPSLNNAIHSLKLQAVANALQLTEQAAAARFAEAYRILGSNTAVLDSFGIDGQNFFLETWRKLALSDFIIPNPELVVALHKLRETTGLIQVILTNSNSQMTVAKKLAAIGIQKNFFAAIYTSIDLGVNKPNANAFVPLWENHATNPSKVLYVGDRVETDIEPAQKLGIKTALIATDKPEQVTTIADIFCTSAVDLCHQILNNW